VIGSSRIVAEQTYERGLEDLVAGDTAISEIDGSTGRLLYRGYPIEDLVGRVSFEETTYLVLFGEMPDTNGGAILQPPRSKHCRGCRRTPTRWLSSGP
jgi:citrate synthase